MEQLKRMAIFARVVETGSMSAAARALGLSPSAVSQQMRALETHTGVALLHRSTRRLSVTTAGAAYYESCAEMLAAAARASQRLAEQRDAPVGELRIAAALWFAAEYLAPALAPLLRANPELKLRLFASNERVDLVEARIDLAIRVGRLDDSSLVARPLARWEEVVLAAPAYLAAKGVPTDPEELASHAWLILTPLGDPQQLSFQRGEERRVVKVSGRISGNADEALLALAREGMGLTRNVLPKVAADLASGQLVRVLPTWSLAPIGVWALTPQREAQPAKVRHAIEALRLHMGAVA